MGTFCTPVLFLVIFVGVINANNQCTEELSLGKILDVTTSPEILTEGQPSEVTFTLETTLKPSVIWTINNKNGDTQITYPVPERDDGSTRSSSKRKSSNFEFTLHLDSYTAKYGYRVVLYLAHPCNVIRISTDVNHLMNLTGLELPTALAVPKAVIDLSNSERETISVGIKVNPEDMVLTQAYHSVSTKRQNDLLYSVNRYGSEDPVRMFWREWGQTTEGPIPYRRDEIKREMTVVKYPKKIKNLQSITVMYQCHVNARGAEFSVASSTKVLLNATSVPAIGLISYEYNYGMLEGVYNDTDGTILIPYIDDQNKTLPRVVECYAEAGVSVPFIATARIHRSAEGSLIRSQLLDGLYVDTEGTFIVDAYQAYVVDVPPVGETADFICSAANGDLVTNLAFKTISITPVKVISRNETTNPLNETTFSDGLRFTCGAEGTPTPSIRFYHLDQYRMSDDYIISGKDILADVDDSFKELKNGRFSVESSGGETTLVISPGNNPFPYSEKRLRIKCVAANQFLAASAYIDFIANNDAMQDV